MRHRVAGRHLGRDKDHRKALFRNLMASLILHKRIRTTVAKAKAVRPHVEKLITLAKEDTFENRRKALKVLPNDRVIRELFTVVGPKVKERPGGYTRILHLGRRQGDGAEMALLELVDFAEEE